MGGLMKFSLCLVVLALLGGTTEAVNRRTLSGLHEIKASTVILPNATAPASLAATIEAISPNFPANLTGNLTGIQLPNATELLRIEQYVLNRTRPSVKSFIDGASRTIDCVPILSQLSLSHPALQNHTVQMVPPTLNMTLNSSAPKSNLTAPAANTTSQPYTLLTPAANATSVNRTGLNISGGCPSRCIPVPRLTVADIARFGSLNAFLNSGVNKKAPPRNVTGPFPDPISHEYASTYPISANIRYHGIQTTMSVWSPFVATPPGNTEFSLSQVWVLAGANDQQQSVEVGWQVAPVFYSDNKPHLFIFSTPDGYSATSTGCYAGYNCPNEKFVCTSTSVYPTIALQSSDVTRGTVVEYKLLVVRDPKNGNWWVQLNNEWVGYYPGQLFAALAQSAEIVDYGGEIVDSAHFAGAPPNAAHTRTQMGSGVEYTPGVPFQQLIRTVAYHADSQYLDQNLTPQKLQVRLADWPGYYNPSCYSGEFVPSVNYDGTPGPMYFFFGGQGYSYKCPT